MHRGLKICLAALLVGCGGGSVEGTADSGPFWTGSTSDGSSGGEGTAGPTATSGNPTSGTPTDTDEPTADSGALFDVGTQPDLGDLPPVDMCKVNDDGNAVGECEPLCCVTTRDEAA